jgi:hypothetical protein
MVLRSKDKTLVGDVREKNTVIAKIVAIVIHTIDDGVIILSRDCGDLDLSDDMDFDGDFDCDDDDDSDSDDLRDTRL